MSVGRWRSSVSWSARDCGRGDLSRFGLDGRHGCFHGAVCAACAPAAACPDVTRPSSHLPELRGACDARGVGCSERPVGMLALFARLVAIRTQCGRAGVVAAGA